MSEKNFQPKSLLLTQQIPLKPAHLSGEHSDTNIHNFRVEKKKKMVMAEEVEEEEGGDKKLPKKKKLPRDGE